MITRYYHCFLTLYNMCSLHACIVTTSMNMVQQKLNKKKQDVHSITHLHFKGPKHQITWHHRLEQDKKVYQTYSLPLLIVLQWLFYRRFHDIFQMVMKVVAAFYVDQSDWFLVASKVLIVPSLKEKVLIRLTMWNSVDRCSSHGKRKSVARSWSWNYEKKLLLVLVRTHRTKWRGTCWRGKVRKQLFHFSKWYNQELHTMHDFH